MQQIDSMTSNERQEHALNCCSPRIITAYYEALTRRTATIVTAKGSAQMWTILHKSLSYWAESGKFPQYDNFLQGVPITLQSALQRSLQGQEVIGWHYAFQGYLSIAWLSREATKVHSERQVCNKNGLGTSTKKHGLQQLSWGRQEIPHCTQVVPVQWKSRTWLLMQKFAGCMI